jgi:hypothetical protein
MCGQDFTRRYNANRHNQNIHLGKAEIVRFVEYVVGRLSGKYLPGDPLLYRIKKRNKNKHTFVHENEDNNRLYDEKSDSARVNSLPCTQEPRENRIIDDKNTNFSNPMVSTKTRNNTIPAIKYLNGLFQSDKKMKEFLQKEEIEQEIKTLKECFMILTLQNVCSF